MKYSLQEQLVEDNYNMWSKHMGSYIYIYKTVILYITTKRDVARLEAAEIRILRSVTGYTRLDKIRSEVIGKELEISAIQDLRLKYKQNWINHLERMDNTRLSKYTLNYKPRGRRDRGRPRKRWQCVDAGTGQRPNPWRKMMLSKFIYQYMHYWFYLS